MKILVLEDDPFVREMAVAGLEDAGYEVIEAASGEEALRLLQAGATLDILLTDIRLPRATDVIDKSFFASTGVFSSRARVTLWQRAGPEVQTLPRSLYRRSSFRAPVRTFPDLGPRGFQPATNRV
jgi:hypothetical protein